MNKRSNERDRESHRGRKGQKKRLNQERLPKNGETARERERESISERVREAKADDNKASERDLNYDRKHGF